MAKIIEEIDLTKPIPKIVPCEIYRISTLRLKPYVRTNLIARVSCIHGHEIHVVSYACLDGDCRLYEADYVVYILMRPPPN